MGDTNIEVVNLLVEVLLKNPNLSLEKLDKIATNIEKDLAEREVCDEADTRK